MKLFWIIFILQICNILSFNEVIYTIRRTIKETFNYDCEKQPSTGEILFWKISTHQEIKNYTNLCNGIQNEKRLETQKYRHGITQFQSNEIYIIFTKVNRYYMYLFYWLGSEVPLVSKKVAAKYTLQLYSQLKIYYRTTNPLINVFISREKEGIESELYQYLILSPKENISDHRLYDYYQHTGILLNHPHLYTVTGFGNNTCMKRVPISTSWIKNDTCIILETGYSLDRELKIFFYCGTMANEATCNHAMKFSSFISFQYMTHLHMQPQFIDEKDHPQFKLIIELLEDESYCSPKEVDNSDDHLKDAVSFVNECNARVSLSKISNDRRVDGGLVKEQITRRSLSYIDFLLSCSNIIFNTDSISGVFVRFGSPVLDRAVKTLQYAEEYAHNIESNALRSTPLYIDGAIFPNTTMCFLNLKMNFINYPLEG